MKDTSSKNKDDKSSDRPLMGDIQIAISGSVNGQVGVGNQIIQMGKTDPKRPPADSNGRIAGADPRSPSAMVSVGDLPTLQPSELLKLRRSISVLFNESELRDLCFDLGLDYDDLPGAGKKDKARELVAYYHRRGRIGELVQACLRRRPGIFKGGARSPPAHRVQHDRQIENSESRSKPSLIVQG